MAGICVERGAVDHISHAYSSCGQRLQLDVKPGPAIDGPTPVVVAWKTEPYESPRISSLGMAVGESRGRQSRAIVRNDMVADNLGEVGGVVVAGSQPGPVGKEEILPLEATQCASIPAKRKPLLINLQPALYEASDEGIQSHIGAGLHQMEFQIQEIFYRQVDRLRRYICHDFSLSKGV